jgi:hypothetical protein
MKEGMLAMAADIKNTTKETADEVVENAVKGADLVTGAAVTVADNLARVVNHPAREAHRIERLGAATNKKLSRDVTHLVKQTNKKLGRDVSHLVNETNERVEAFMPERVALAGIHAIKARARRKDMMGAFAYRTLQIANRGLEAVLSTVIRLERATQPPARTPSSHARPVARAAQSARRSVTSTARSTRSRVRRSTARARRSERATA